MDFHNRCTSLHSHQQCLMVPFLLYPHQHLLLFVVLMFNLTRMRWNLSVVLICISFMDRNAKHCLVCLLAIFISSENYVFICPFAKWIVFMLFSFLSSLCILDINLLPAKWLVKTSLPLCGSSLNSGSSFL
jgi:hypothetical protein